MGDPHPAQQSPAPDGLVTLWARVLDGDATDGPLPAHSDGCVGCGPANPHGLHLVVRREGDAVISNHVFDDRHVGGPGIAHGGAVAMAFDDLFGFLLYVAKDLAVTRSLTIDYLAPVRLGTTYQFRGELGDRVGRRIPVRAELRDPSGILAATASATFVAVPADHFASLTYPPVDPTH